MPDPLIDVDAQSLPTTPPRPPADLPHGLIAPIIAVAFVRRRMFRNARPLAIASGSGSLCSMIRMRSASLR